MVRKSKKREIRDRRETEQVSTPARSADKPLPNSAGTTFAVAKARKLAAETLPASLYHKPTRLGDTERTPAPSSVRRTVHSYRPEDRTPAVSRAEAVSPAKRKLAEDRSHKLASTVKREEPKLKPERLETCKARPLTSRGGGGSRQFVPWCKKK